MFKGSIVALTFKKARSKSRSENVEDLSATKKLSFHVTFMDDTQDLHVYHK